MADQKRPVDHLLDLFVYAPLGLIMNLEEVVPELIEKGHQQVNMARMFGKFAVDTGTKEARKRVEHAQEQVGLKPPSGNGRGPVAAPAAAPTTADAAPAQGVAAPGADDLAIPDYDALSASQVVPRLEGLADDELDAVQRYEAANRGRKTILSKIAQLRGRERASGERTIGTVTETARRAEPHDLPRLVELHRQATSELRLERGGEMWAALEDRDAPPDLRLDADDLFVLAATIDDVVVGYGRVERRALADGSQLAVITDVYVEPEARGIGLGEALLDLALAWAREHGCRAVDSVALPGMRATKNFFEAAGLVARAIAVHRSL